MKFTVSQMAWTKYKYVVTDPSYEDDDIYHLIKSGEIERHTTPLGDQVLLHGKVIGTWTLEDYNADKEEVQDFDFSRAKRRIS